MILAAITCTSRTNTWNRGSLKHNPSVANQRQYESFKIDVPHRASFDPRATRYQTNWPTNRQKNDFLNAISFKESPPLFASLLSFHYDAFSYSEEEKGIFREKRLQMYDALKDQMNEMKPTPQHKGAFEVVGTRGQNSTKEWKRIRALHCSAQPSHEILHFKTESAEMHFLQRHLWGMKRVETPSMTFGTQHEEARRSYAGQQKKSDTTAAVETCGLCLDTDLIGLSCSPDGIKKSQVHTYPCILLEIKCLFSLKDHDSSESWL